MSNVLGKSPWIIDTASATPVTTKPLIIKELRLTGVATNACVVKDGSGHEIWSGTLGTGLTTMDSTTEEGISVPDWARGLAVTTLTSGAKLYVHYM